MVPKPEVSLVIPSYNAGGKITQTLDRLQRFFQDKPYAHEIVIVDDGSVDQTATALRRIAPGYPELKIAANERNMGKGFSVKKGVLAATGTFVVYMDVDLAYPIEDLESLLKPLWERTHEVSVGSRVHPASLFHLHPQHLRYIYQRYLMSRVFNWVVRTWFAISATDTQCGFKGFAAEAARAIFSHVRLAGFAFDVEVLLIAHRLGLRLAEVPVTCTYNGEVSTVKVLGSGTQALMDLAKIYLWDRQGGYRSPCQGFSHRT